MLLSLSRDEIELMLLVIPWAKIALREELPKTEDPENRAGLELLLEDAKKLELKLEHTLPPYCN